MGVVWIHSLQTEVMWPLGDEEGMFDFSGEKHGVLFSSSPREKEGGGG